MVEPSTEPMRPQQLVERRRGPVRLECGACAPSSIRRSSRATAAGRVRSTAVAWIHLFTFLGLPGSSRPAASSGTFGTLSCGSSSSRS